MTKNKKKPPNVGAPFKCPTLEISMNELNNSFKTNCNNVIDFLKPRQTISSLETLDLGETSCACPSKMGEGRDGPSDCPLPIVPFPRCWCGQKRSPLN